MNVNFARLNHILIPTTKSGRDRFRRSIAGRAARPAMWLYASLSDEGRTIALAAVVVGALGLDVARTETYLLWAVVTALLAASLAVARAFAAPGLRVEVVAPPRVTVGERAVLAIELHNAGDEELASLRVRGPFLPWDGAWTTPRPRLASLPPGARARLEVGARFVARGEHHLDAFDVARLVPLGLAMGPACVSAGTRFLVVPRIANVTRISLALGRRLQPGGVALASRTGESMDLLGVRPYRAGDRIRDLHAKTWARRGQPIVREWQDEHFTRVGVVLDASAKDERTFEAAISLAAGVVARLSRGEALIDVLIVGERVHDLTIGRSLGFLDQALDLLACAERTPPATVDALLARIHAHLARLSAVVVVTPEWDGGRLAERVRAHGVSTLVALVRPDGDLGAPPGPEVRVASVTAIERGEALAL